MDNQEIRWINKMGRANNISDDIFGKDIPTEKNIENLAVYIIMHPTNAIDIASKCENSKGELINKLCNNKFMWESLWLKYIDEQLPNLNNDNNFDVKDLKILYKKASDNYKNPYNYIINNGTNGKTKYNIIYNNAVSIKELFENIENNINVIPENIVYIDQVNDMYNTSLLYAAMNDNTKMVKMLLKRGSNVDAQNSLKNTALHYAVKNNNLKMVKSLLKHNANAKITNNNNKTVLGLAHNNLSDRTNSDEILDLLTKYERFGNVIFKTNECKCLTKRGDKCTRPHLPGSKFCAIHKNC